MSGAPELSIVMPAYDEEAGIRAAVGEALEAAAPLVASLELVVVDDGSRDATGAILDELAAADPRVRVLHGENRGHGPALSRGLDAARGGWLLLLDSDRQVALDGLPALFDEARRAGGLLGIRGERRDPAVRRVISRAMRGWLRWLFGVELVDGGTPLKLLPAECWHELRPLLPDDFPIPAVALAVHALRSRGVVQHDVPHRAREHGQSKLRGAKLAGFSLRAAFALARLRLPAGSAGPGS